MDDVAADAHVDGHRHARPPGRRGQAQRRRAAAGSPPGSGRPPRPALRPRRPPAGPARSAGSSPATVRTGRPGSSCATLSLVPPKLANSKSWIRPAPLVARCVIQCRSIRSTRNRDRPSLMGWAPIIRMTGRPALPGGDDPRAPGRPKSAWTKRLLRRRQRQAIGRQQVVSPLGQRSTTPPGSDRKVHSDSWANFSKFPAYTLQHPQLPHPHYQPLGHGAGGRAPSPACSKTTTKATFGPPAGA